MFRRLLTLVLAGLLAISWLAGPAGASWAAAGTGSVIAKSTTVAPPASLTATCFTQVLTMKIRLDWPASASPWVASYEIFGGPTGNTPTLQGTTTAPTVTFNTDGLVLGSYTYTVRAVYLNWHSASSPSASRTVLAGLLCS